MGCVRVAYPLLIWSSAQATGFRVATALNALCASALRFTLAVWREEEGELMGANKSNRDRLSARKGHEKL